MDETERPAETELEAQGSSEVDVDTNEPIVSREVEVYAEDDGQDVLEPSTGAWKSGSCLKSVAFDKARAGQGADVVPLENP